MDREKHDSGAYQQPSHSIGVQCGNEVRVYQLAAR
jgi:hypothetical protein